MSIFDKMFGHEEKPKQAPQQQSPQPPPPPQGYGYQQPPQQQYAPPQSNDEQAIARYKYMLKTAPPETIEQAHQEAFAQLTPQQRAQVLQQLTSAAPPAERQQMSAPGADDPQNLARMATRAEMRQPGTMERIFGSSSAPGAPSSGPGLGTILGGSLLTSLAGGFIGSAIADHFFNNTSIGRGYGGPGFGGGFGGGGGNFGGGYGGGTQIINETTNYYGNAPTGRDNEVRENADDAPYAASANFLSDNQADDQAEDDQAQDDQADDNSYDDSSDDSSGYDDNSSSDNSGGYGDDN
jgi:hypothetical protein